MKHYQDFTYNPDFEWHETEINLGNDTIKLLIPNYIIDDFFTIHQRLVSIIKWVENHRDFIQKQCLAKLLGFVPTDHKENELKPLCISLEKGQCFEILLQHIAFQGFITLTFNKIFELEHYQLDK
jgi:hypothetical protein